MKVTEDLSATMYIDNVPDLGDVIVTVSKQFVEVQTLLEDKTYRWTSLEGLAIKHFLACSVEELAVAEPSVPKFIVDRNKLKNMVRARLQASLRRGTIDRELYDAMVDMMWCKYIKSNGKIRCPLLIDQEDFEKISLHLLDVPMVLNPTFESFTQLLSMIKTTVLSSKYCDCVRNLC